MRGEDSTKNKKRNFKQFIFILLRTFSIIYIIFTQNFIIYFHFIKTLLTHKYISSKKTFTSGGIRVRNMGRIMKMAMFIQKKPAKNFIREFKRYGCHCWPKGRTILGGQGRPQDDVDRLAAFKYFIKCLI